MSNPVRVHGDIAATLNLIHADVLSLQQRTLTGDYDPSPWDIFFKERDSEQVASRLRAAQVTDGQFWGKLAILNRDISTLKILAEAKKPKEELFRSPTVDEEEPFRSPTVDVHQDTDSQISSQSVTDPEQQIILTGSSDAINKNQSAIFAQVEKVIKATQVARSASRDAAFRADWAVVADEAATAEKEKQQGILDTMLAKAGISYNIAPWLQPKASAPVPLDDSPRATSALAAPARPPLQAPASGNVSSPAKEDVPHKEFEHPYLRGQVIRITGPQAKVASLVEIPPAIKEKLLAEFNYPRTKDDMALAVAQSKCNAWLESQGLDYEVATKQLSFDFIFHMAEMLARLAPQPDSQ